MPTNQASKPAVVTIRYGGLWEDNPEDSDFFSDQSSDSSGMSSDLESIISGDHQLVADALAKKKKKEAQEAKAREAKEA